ncbi:Actin cortical patch SUR7/pH-response regulator PalI [Penicillium camemberti]|uniref:Actin cortical patch SUR7/pH-response regulator PalI n=1 Tax=Penicillium camemberti (strain FM 013) TaxID=1429867 RepID=A0A0G4NWH7_PENC3|nr:Actin cortical patch SUR7/pH-response regulator PalI [Penicillium camemberti]
MSDFKGLFQTVAVFVAFILTLLCLFAGTQKNFLEDVDLLTLSTPSVSTGSGAHDFYSVHVLSYCQGTLITTDAGVEVTRNVTECSNRTISSSFDPTQAWPEEVTSSPQLGWPRVISDDFHAFRMTSQVMAVMYSIGIGAMGIAMLVRVWATLAPKASQGPIEFWFFVLGSFSVSIASIIATVIGFEFVALINAHGKGSNVSAQYGEKFLGMTWAAVGLLVAGSVACFANAFVNKRAASAPAPVSKDIEG